MKRAFSLSEVLVTIMIVAVMAVILLHALKPSVYEAKTNLANAKKTIEDISHALVQITDIETTQCPTHSYMVKPAGTTDWELTVLNSDGDVVDAAEFVELLGNHLKYEASSFNFCDTTQYCNNSDIAGARLAGGVIIGIEKYSDIQDCPAYRIPGEETDQQPPQKFNPSDGNYYGIPCWGQLYIDVRGPQKGADELGSDIYTFGLGEYGIVQ